MNIRKKKFSKMGYNFVVVNVMGNTFFEKHCLTGCYLASVA